VGNRLWPGVLIGAIIANVTTGDSITANGTLTSIGIAAGNTLEALLGAHLVRHFAGGRHVFDRARVVFRFAALAAFTSTTVSATLGVACVWLAGFAKRTDISAIWVTWWVGDAGGDLIFAPVLILWAMNWRLRWDRSRIFEAALLLIVLCVLAVIAFSNVLAPGRPVDLGRAFLCMPALLWAAFRFGQRETAATFLLASGIAIWGWLHGQVAGDLSPAYELLELQAYLGVTSIAILAVGAEVSQRRRHEQLLDSQADVLRRQSQLLDLAPVRDTDDRIESWNSGAERLYGFKRSEVVGRVSHDLLRTRFPEPLEQCRAKLFDNGHWQGELEHETRGGRRFVVASQWVLYRNTNGQPEAILEVNNDITELRRAEEARLRLAAIVESSDDAIFAKSLDGVILSWNSGAERIYGYSALEAIGWPVAILAPPSHEEEMSASWNTSDAAKNGTIMRQRVVGRTELSSTWR
jgi:PAS domain S-box-containing protein